MVVYVTRHEKNGLMYTKYTFLYYGTYLLYCLRYLNSVNSIRFPIECCINGEHFIRLLFLSAKLFKFEIQNVVKFCVHISPIFSFQVTYSYLCLKLVTNIYTKYHKCNEFSRLKIFEDARLIKKFFNLQG